MANRSHRPRQCVYCAHQAITKHGFTSSRQQRFRCKSCRRTFIRHAGKRLYRIRLKKQRLRFARLLHLGHSVRKDAHILGVSHSTVWRWRHEAMKRIRHSTAQRPTVPAPQAIVQRKPLLRQRLFWGKLGNVEWADRRSESHVDLNRGNVIDERITVFFATISHEQTRRFSVTVKSWPDVDSLPDEITERIHPSTRVFLMKGTWLIANNRPAGPNGDVEDRQLWLGRASPYYSSCRATQDLSHLFIRWMARFRGVALKYLKSYAALFESTLARGYVKHPKWWEPCRWVRI